MTCVLTGPEAGNNSAAGGALVPMLSLGVPGSGTTAVLLAMLMTMNITPGPLLFKNNPDVVWGLIAALFFANFVLLILNIPMVRMFTKILLLPPKYLMPIVGMISFVGIYGISGSSFDLLLMIGLTILGSLPFIGVATAYLLIAKIAVSFLLILGPMFIMMAFFPATREIFRAWTGQCFNYILLMIMYPLAFSIFIQVLDSTVFKNNINLEKSIMVFIVFFAMVILSVQIPALCSTLSGGVGISGLVGSITSTAKGLSKGGKMAKDTAKGMNKGGKGLLNKARDIGKGKILPG